MAKMTSASVQSALPVTPATDGTATATADTTTTMRQPTFNPERGLWVALRDAPSPYSHDEALLLCETFPGEWVSWVPGYGEITLSRGQFHHASSRSVASA